MSRTPATIRNRLEYLADDVELSSRSAADRLRDLGAAVDGEQAADTWAAADIFQIIDPDTIAEQVRSQSVSDRFVRFLEVLRNVLVFVPIAVTWLGIWLALESYTAAIQADPALAEQSFLFLWQQGFGDRLWLTLSRIAFIDGALLLLVAVLTLIVLSRNNQKDREAEQVRAELASVLADAALALTARRSNQSINFAYRFDQAAQELLAELRQERLRVQDLADRKEKEVGDLAAFGRDFMTSTQAMLAATQSLQQVPIQVGRILTSLSTAFQQLADQQKDQQQEFTQSARQSTGQLKQLTDTYRATSVDMQGMGTNLQAMGTNLQVMGADLRDVIQAAKNTVAQNAQAVSDMRTTAGDLVAVQTQFLAALAHERGMLEKGTQGTQAAVQSLQQIYQALDQSLTNLPPLLQQLSTQQHEFVTALRQAATQFQQLTQSQQALGSDVRTLGSDLRAAVDALQSAASETAHAAAELSRTLPAVK